MTYTMVILLCFLFSVFVSSAEVIEDDGDAGPLSNYCIRCICEMNGCPNETSCTDVCGPFRITYGYWSSALAHGDAAQHQDFQKCTLNAWCAVRTVQAHMKRFLPKCVAESGPRSVCETALALHNFGARSCTKQLAPDVKDLLASCLHRRTWHWLLEDVHSRGGFF